MTDVTLDCRRCRGGYRVGYLGGPAWLVAPIAVPMAGERRVTIAYTVDGPRTLKIGVNGTRLYVREVTGPGWETPQYFTFTSNIPAGTVVFALYNDESPAPDIDAIVIS